MVGMTLFFIGKCQCCEIKTNVVKSKPHVHWSALNVQRSTLSAQRSATVHCQQPKPHVHWSALNVQRSALSAQRPLCIVSNQKPLVGVRHSIMFNVQSLRWFRIGCPILYQWFQVGPLDFNLLYIFQYFIK